MRPSFVPVACVAITSPRPEGACGRGCGGVAETGIHPIGARLSFFTAYEIMMVMLKTLSRSITFAAAVASGLLLVTPALPAGAAGSTITHSGTPTTSVDGGTVNLTVTSPLYGAGTATRWLQEKIDPSTVHLTSTSQIKAPEGWKVQYSTDGMSFTDVPPSTPEAWGRVEYVRARGSLTSDGVVDGKQAVTTAQSLPLNAGAPGVLSSTTGDGWDVFFDGEGHVFNETHLSTQFLDCHELSGATCAGSWPMPITALTGLRNNTQTSGWVDEEHHHVWVAGYNASSAGFLCVDISTITSPGLCGGSFASAFIRTGGAVEVSVSSSRPLPMVESGGLLYLDNSMEPGVSAAIGCVDPQANDGRGALCPGQPYLLQSGNDPSVRPGYGFFQKFQGKLFLYNIPPVFQNAPSVLWCFDPATKANCAGWPAQGRQTSPRLGLTKTMVFPANKSNMAAICLFNQLNVGGMSCFGIDGSPVSSTTASAFRATVSTIYGPAYPGPAVVVGSHVYNVWGTVSSGRDEVICWDVASGQDGARCPGFASGLFASADPYTVTADPQDSQCLWENGDKGRIIPFRLNGTVGCPAPTTTANGFFPNLAPSFGCTAGASSWSKLMLSTPSIGPDGAASGTVNVFDSSGQAIAGWQGVSIPANGVINLSQLPVSLTGPHPKFMVHLNDRNPSVREMALSLTSLGNSPQLCISPTVSYACPGGYAAVPSLPNVIATILATDDTAVAPGVGVDVTVRPSNPQTCTGAVAGTVLDTNGNPVPGLPVSITGPDGAPVSLNGSDYTTTTKADGTYSFPGLRPGLAYAVTFPDTSVATAVSATVPSGDGAGTTTAADGSVTSNAAGVTAGATTIIDALYTQLIDLTPDAVVVPKNTTTTLHPLNNDEPATGNTLVTSSVKLCGPSEAPPACTQSSVTVTEGTFVANPDGTVDFTPATDFTGVVTPVTYQASDTGPTTGSAVINVTVVGAPTAQPVTSIDDVNVTQTLTPLSGATVDPAAGWASTPLLLCGASESAGSCTQSSVSVDGVGVYTVTPDNEVSFVPAHNYVGSPTPVPFDVVDGIGQRASSTLAVTVRPTIPEVPSSPSVTAGTTSATVSFDVPAWDGGSPVLSYLVEDGAGKHSCTVTVSGPGPYSCTVTGLVPGKVYGFVITATNAVGTGPEAAVSTRVGVLACTPGTYVEQRLGLLQSTTDFQRWTTLGQENGFVNAIAYRPADGFLYGIGTAARDLGGPENHLMRVAGDGSVTDLGVVEGLPATRSEAKLPAGAFDPFTGHLVVGGRGHLYSIDVDTHRATAIALPDGVSRIGWDLVIQGEWLWTVTSTQVVGINLSTDESVSYDLPGGYQSHGYGSVWPGTDDSSLFFQSNATGDITKVTGLGSSPSFSKVGNLPSAPRNDGAACPGAPS